MTKATTEPPRYPGTVPVAPEGECNGCNWGWERYQNKHGVWLHRNATDTIGVMCWIEEKEGNDGQG